MSLSFHLVFDMDRYSILLVVVCALIAVKGHEVTDPPPLSIASELQLYRNRVRILYDMLQYECGYSDLRRQRRDMIMETEEIQLQVEMALYKELVERLRLCRQNKMGDAHSSDSEATSPKPTKASMQKAPPPTVPSSKLPDLPKPYSNSPYEECRSAIDLNESWRLDHNGSKIIPDNGNYNCDTLKMKRGGNYWFRFSGEGGDKMADKCIPEFSCGGAVALWTDDVMPREVGVVSNVTAYGSWFTRNCRQYVAQISVMRCSYHIHDFIYKYISQSDQCPFSFCGMKVYH